MKQVRTGDRVYFPETRKFHERLRGGWRNCEGEKTDDMEIGWAIVSVLRCSTGEESCIACHMHGPTESFTRDVHDGYHIIEQLVAEGSIRLPKEYPTMHYSDFWRIVRDLCARFDCSVTSAIRTPARNAAVGGAPHSRHQLAHGGNAADLVPDNPNNMAPLAVEARRSGLVAIIESDHVHVHAEPRGQDG